MEEKKRIEYIDIARGIAIILMIIGHIVPNGLARKVIFSFHMPLFILVSGYFFKEKESFKELVIKVLKSLILPYAITIIVFNTLNGLINNQDILLITRRIIKQLIFSISLQGNIDFGAKSVGPIYFIPLLALIKILYYFICRITKEKYLHRALVCYIITLIGVFIGIKGYWLPFSIDIALACVLFMFVGNMAKKYNLLEKILKDWRIIILFVIAWIIGLKFGNIEIAIRSYPSVITTYITAISGTIIIFYLSALIEKHFHVLSKVLTWYGRNSMYILCMHRLESGLVEYKNLSGNIVFICKMAIVTLGTAIINLIKVIYKKGSKKMKKYDYLIVGSGLFGAIFAYEANKKGKKCLVIDKRSHIGGNIYTENIEGINVHKYGAHIFHTSNVEVWEYIQRFAEFNRYTNSPVAIYKDELYNMPFNMNTFNKLWGVIKPEDAKAKIEEEKKTANITEPKNLEEQAISLVGRTIYEKLVKGYTEKQWGRRCEELPSFIIKRLPVRFTYDNNYFNDAYQGIPVGGYTQIIEKLLEGIEVRLNCDFFDNREELENIAEKIVFTGPIDKYYDYCYGELEYRSLRFETEILDIENYQGNAVVNYTEYEIPYTRIIEHKHFEYGTQPKTIITREYPDSWNREKEAYYPINNEKNNTLYEKYAELSKQDKKVIFGGRLGKYKYYDMDKVIEEAIKMVKNELYLN